MASSSAHRRAVPYLVNTRPGALDSAVLGLAHRGADLDYENTAAAMRRAVAAGFRYMEIDVRTSADGELVVFHDATLERITTGSGRLNRHSWQRLAALRVLPRRLRSDTGASSVTEEDIAEYGEPLLRFADALELFPECYFNVDLKDTASVPVFADIVQRHRAEHRVLAASFQDRRRFKLQRLLPQVATSAGMSTTAWATAAARLRILSRLHSAMSPLAALQVPMSVAGIAVVSPGFVEQAHRAGLQVHVWVVNDPQEAGKLMDMGVDGIVTDDSRQIPQLLAQRGHWPQI